MAQPLRKIFQKNLLSGAEAAARGWREHAAREDAAPRNRPAENSRRQPREGQSRDGRGGGRPRRTLDLSAAATAALGLALVAAVGWSFFMGYLVGRGEHPERGVESVAGLLRPRGAAPAAPPAVPEEPRLLPGEEVLRPQAGVPAGAGTPPSAGAPESAAQEVSTPAAPAVVTAPQGEPATGGSAAQRPAGAPAAAGAYPFNRPQGDGLAAWGISDGAQAPAQPQARQGAPRQAQAAAAQAAQSRATAVPAKAAEPAEPRFDYVFQAAAFKGPVDAERLRARLEGAGLRARVRQSGKVRLVLVSVRGSAAAAAKVRGELSAMGLGRPIQLEKKPVQEPTGGKGRRRSAP